MTSTSQYFFQETLGIQVLGPGKLHPLLEESPYPWINDELQKHSLPKPKAGRVRKKMGSGGLAKCHGYQCAKKMLCCLILGPISNLFQGWKATQFWDWKSGYGLHKVRRSMGQGSEDSDGFQSPPDLILEEVVDCRLFADFITVQLGELRHSHRHDGTWYQVEQVVTSTWKWYLISNHVGFQEFSWRLSLRNLIQRRMLPCFAACSFCPTPMRSWLELKGCEVDCVILALVVCWLIQELQHCCCDIFFRMWSYHQEQMYSNWGPGFEHLPQVCGIYFYDTIDCIINIQLYDAILYYFLYRFYYFRFL